jgi:phenylpropionate dioxygenase-like ring-hydroxylating dioxygenase large terminal subunit
MIEDKVLLNDWHVVALSSAVREGQVIKSTLLKEELVVWRVNGQVQVWKDLCIHRGAQLSMGTIQDGCLKCPYHGWLYSPEGKCVKIPAHPEQTPPPRAKTFTYQVKEAYGFIWTCLGEPAHGLVEFPEYGDPAYRNVHCGPYALTASAPRIIENSLDVAHFAIVHDGILGDSSHAEVPDYPVEVTPEEVLIARDIGFWQNDPDGTGKPGKVFYNLWVHRPFTKITRKKSNGPMFVIFQSVAPVDEYHSKVYSCVTMNYGHETADEVIRGFQDKVFAQDIAVIESQRPELLPLDLQAELHLRSDRASIAYRQWLGKMGLSFGTA